MVLNRNDDIPLFKQLRNILIEQIKSGEYKPGEMLPSEIDLIDKYSMSRTTIRKAVQTLVQEGYAYTVHGKGTFVVETGLTQYLNNLTSFSFDVAERGMTASRELISLKTISPDAHLATKLRIPPSSKVIRIERLMLADMEPVSYSITYISVSNIAPYHADINETNLNKQGLYTLLEKLGVHLTGGEQIISATGATTTIANHLKIEVGSPLMFSERIAHKNKNIPIEYTEMWVRADKTRWRIILGPYETGK